MFGSMPECGAARESAFRSHIFRLIFNWLTVWWRRLCRKPENGPWIPEHACVTTTPVWRTGRKLLKKIFWPRRDLSIYSNALSTKQLFKISSLRCSRVSITDGRTAQSLCLILHMLVTDWSTSGRFWEYLWTQSQCKCAQISSFPTTVWRITLGKLAPVLSFFQTAWILSCFFAQSWVP